MSGSSFQFVGGLYGNGLDDSDCETAWIAFIPTATGPQAGEVDFRAGQAVLATVQLSGVGTNVQPGSPSPTPTPVPVPRTFAETEAARSGVRTFTNYHNASGLGPIIAYRQVVQVSCKVKDGTIKSVNPDGYWYRIASSPWSDHYYAPANTFLNGDPPNGPYSRNTDFSVPDCSGSAPTSAPPAAPPTVNNAAPPATSKANHHLWIVSLGDSYTAGNGAGANYDSCHRSYNSYPWLYMNRLRDAHLNVDIWQQACSGNVTTDVPGQIRTIVNNTPVKHSADIVLLTIGGNDLHFSDIVADCLFNRGAAVGGCSYRVDNALSDFDAVLNRTKNLLQSAAQEFPNAQIVLLGYPLLTSPKCPRTSWNGTLAEAQNAFDLDQATMVKRLRTSTGSNRFHFISVAQQFHGHGPCASSSTQYVRGVDADPTWASYHPNAQGDQVIANLLYGDGVQNW